MLKIQNFVGMSLVNIFTISSYSIYQQMLVKFVEILIKRKGYGKFNFYGAHEKYFRLFLNTV